MRTSSEANIKRFSKMFSVITELPSARAESTIICACMSVGKPGERKRLDVDRLDTLGTVHMDAILDALAVDTHELHLLEHHAQVNGAKARDIDTAIVGHQRTGNDKGTGLDAVGHHRDG